MKTKTICISAASLYESKTMHKVRDLQTGRDYLLTKWGSFLVVEANNHFVRGVRARKDAA